MIVHCIQFIVWSVLLAVKVENIVLSYECWILKLVIIDKCYKIARLDYALKINNVTDFIKKNV